MTCSRCGADHLALTFAPDAPEAVGLLCLTCGSWSGADGSGRPRDRSGSVRSPGD